MPLPQYSPWQEASMSVNRLGGNMQDLFMDIARQRAQQEYQRQMMSLREQQLRQQAQVDQQRIATSQATAGRQNAAGAIDTERLNRSRAFGAAMGRGRSSGMSLGEGPS